MRARSVAVMALAVSAACSRGVPELAGFTAVDVTVSRVQVLTTDPPGGEGPQWRILVRLQGPGALVAFVRGDNRPYGQVRWSTGVWVAPCVSARVSAAASAEDARTYELEFGLDKEPRLTNAEGEFRAALVAGAELEVRLVVGCREHVEARSQWVDLGPQMDALRRDLR